MEILRIKFLTIVTTAVLNTTNKFGWMLNDIRIEKIISAPIWATKYFFGRFQMLDTVPSCNLVQYLGKLMIKP